MKLFGFETDSQTASRLFPVLVVRKPTHDVLNVLWKIRKAHFLFFYSKLELILSIFVPFYAVEKTNVNISRSFPNGIVVSEGCNLPLSTIRRGSCQFGGAWACGRRPPKPMETPRFPPWGVYEPSETETTRPQLASDFLQEIARLPRGAAGHDQIRRGAV